MRPPPIQSRSSSRAHAQRGPAAARIGRPNRCPTRRGPAQSGGASRRSSSSCRRSARRLGILENGLADAPLGQPSRRSCAAPAQVAALEALEVLDVSENQLEAFPEGLAQLTKLRVVKAWVNQLKALPDGFGAGAALEDLNVYNNRLTKLPASLADASNLRLVNCGANKLKTLPPLAKWSKVEELRLHQNSLVSQFLPPFSGLTSSADRAQPAAGGAARVRHPPRPHGDRVQQLLARAPAPIQGAPGGAPGARVPDRAPEPHRGAPGARPPGVHDAERRREPARGRVEIVTGTTSRRRRFDFHAGSRRSRTSRGARSSACSSSTTAASCPCTGHFTPANHPKLERLVVSGNPGLDAKARAQVDAFAATTTKNGGWVRG